MARCGWRPRHGPGYNAGQLFGKLDFYAPGRRRRRLARLRGSLQGSACSCRADLARSPGPLGAPNPCGTSQRRGGTTTKAAAQRRLANPYTYTGRRLDGETGLYYFRYRYYHGELGTFVARDPIRYAAQTLNLYAYVGNSPTNELDPVGLQELSWSYRVTTPPVMDLKPGFRFQVRHTLRGTGRGAMGLQYWQTNYVKVEELLEASGTCGWATQERKRLDVNDLSGDRLPWSVTDTIAVNPEPVEGRQHCFMLATIDRTVGLRPWIVENLTIVFTSDAFPVGANYDATPEQWKQATEDIGAPIIKDADVKYVYLERDACACCPRELVQQPADKLRDIMKPGFHSSVRKFEYLSFGDQAWYAFGGGP